MTGVMIWPTRGAVGTAGTLRFSPAMAADRQRGRRKDCCEREQFGPPHSPWTWPIVCGPSHFDPFRSLPFFAPIARSRSSMIDRPGACGIRSGAQIGYGVSRAVGGPRDRSLTRLQFPEVLIGVPPDADARRTRSDSSVSDSVVVVGNGVSGYACAARLAEREVPVTMIGPGLLRHRPPLSKRALLTGRVPLLADAAQLAERGIAHVDGVVTGCDLARRRLVVSRSAGGAPLEIEAPTLVWATGLRYPKPPAPWARAGRGEHDGRRSRLARPAPGPPAQARRHCGRRADQN